MADEANYEPSATQVDLEYRLAHGNASSRILTTADIEGPEPPDDEGRDYRVEGNDIDDYFGASKEYMTYANETDAPKRSEEGPEAEAEEMYVTRPDMAKDPRHDPNVEESTEEQSGDAPQAAQMSAQSEDSGTRSSTTAKKSTSSSK